MKLDSPLEQSEATVIKNKIRNYSLSWSEQQKKEPPPTISTPGKRPSVQSLHSVSSKKKLINGTEEMNVWSPERWSVR